MNEQPSRPRAAFSLPSILAVLCAVVSFFTGAIGGLLLAICAIVFGISGIVISLSPNVRGGAMSLFSIIAGLVGIIAAVIKAILWFF